MWTRGQLAISLSVCWASQVVLVVKRKQKKPRLPIQETQETKVPSLSREDPLKKTLVTHSSILPRRIPWTEEPDGIQSMRSQRVGGNLKRFSTHTRSVPATTHQGSSQPLNRGQGRALSPRPERESLPEATQAVREQPGCLGRGVVLVTQSCLTLCDPMDGSPPGSSVRGIL